MCDLAVYQHNRFGAAALAVDITARGTVEETRRVEIRRAEDRDSGPRWWVGGLHRGKVRCTMSCQVYTIDALSGCAHGAQGISSYSNQDPILTVTSRRSMNVVHRASNGRCTHMHAQRSP